MPATDRGLTYELNRLAGTLDAKGNPTLAATGAANVWAVTRGLALQGALNARAGASAPHPVPPVAATLTVDNYAGGFVRVNAAGIIAVPSVNVDFALADAPGPGGEVYPDLSAIPDGAAVWADFNGQLGKLKLDGGADVLGSTLKQWITDGTHATVHRDDTDPAHPALLVEASFPPVEPGPHVEVTGIGTRLMCNAFAWAGAGASGPIPDEDEEAALSLVDEPG